MRYKLEKKGGSFILRPTHLRISDSYQSINLKSYYIDKYFRQSNSVDKITNPEVYSDLELLIKEINLFKPKTTVPNKTFKADKPGLSCLRRSPSTGEIRLCYRGKGVNSARTPNTCFLTDSNNSKQSSWVCMRTFNKSLSQYSNTTVYSITPSHPDYQYWSNYMDSEYERLTGVKIERYENRPNIEHTGEDLDLIDLCQVAYSNVKTEDELNLFEFLSKKGLCKINQISTSLYDKEGYWICRFDEYSGGDSSGEMLNGVLSRLNTQELKEAYLVIKSFVKDPFQVEDLFSL